MNKGKRKKTTHTGVGVMINNKIINAVLEINPYDDRFMSITLRGSVNSTFISAYIQYVQAS